MGYDQTFATAAHMLAVLAYHNGDWVTSTTMARSIQTNPGLVRRILSQLAAAGLVETRTGARGGARLAKATHSINLADVFDAVAMQPVLKTSSREPYKPCPVSCKIGNALEGVFSDAEDAMRKQLKKATLKDIMKRL